MKKIDILRNPLCLEKLKFFEQVSRQILRAYVNIWSKNLSIKMPKKAILTSKWGYARCLIVLLLFLFSCSTPPPPLPQPPYVSITESVVKDTPIYLEYVGHVEPYQSVEIKAQVAGTLVGQYFIEGQEVQAGDLLLKIDDRPYRAALSKAQAELAQNLASLRQAQDAAKRNALLVQDQYIAQLDYDQFVTNVYTEEALVKQAEANIETASINLDYCTITAPLTGVTSNLLIYVGNYVPVGGSNPLLSINQVKPVKVNFYVPEKDLPTIMKEMAKTPLKVVAYVQGSAVEGTLSLVNNQVDENTGTILMQAVFPNKEEKLWPGAFVDIHLILGVHESAVLLPSQAVQIGQDGPYVYVLKEDQTVELRSVQIGQKDGGQTIILNGVSPKENVVLEGQINLKPGILVAVSRS